MDDQLETIRENAEHAGDLHMLIERLEKATGLDRDLDIAIARACPFDGWRVERDGSVSAWDGEGWYSLPTEVPTYTHSIDAALALVPKPLWARVQTETRQAMPMAWVTNEATEFCWFSEAATPAIALCIAALKARAAISSHQRGTSE